LLEISHFKDSRIQYFEQKNKGPTAARNIGLSASRGDYIAFLDSDDLWEPTKLEIQTQIMDINPHIILSHTSHDRVDTNKEYLETMSSGKFPGWVYPQILQSCSIATLTVMLRRNKITHLMFEETIRISEDIIFWVEISKISAIQGIDQPLSKVRIHDTNVALDHHAQITGFSNIITHSIQKRADLNDPQIVKVLNEIFLPTN